MLIPLPVLIVCGDPVVGFILGYGTRASISCRHRTQARRRAANHLVDGPGRRKRPACWDDASKSYLCACVSRVS